MRLPAPQRTGARKLVSRHSGWLSAVRDNLDLRVGISPANAGNFDGVRGHAYDAAKSDAIHEIRSRDGRQKAHRTLLLTLRLGKCPKPARERGPNERAHRASDSNYAHCAQYDKYMTRTRCAYFLLRWRIRVLPVGNATAM